MPEYYVRLEDSDEALGPMNEEQLKMLADEGKISPQTPHYLDDIIGWQPIEENQNLASQLWESSRPKLTLKTRSPIPNPPQESKPAKQKLEKPQEKKEELSVEKMLQSSQGKTKETAHITKENRWRNRTAGLSLPLLTLVHLTMAGLMIAQNWEPFFELVENQNWMGMLLSPLFLLSAATLLVGAVLLLSVTAIYPVARYLAMIVMGYFSIQAWNWIHDGLAGGWGILIAGIGFGIGVFWTTITLSFKQFCTAATLAFLGIAAYAWVFFLA